MSGEDASGICLRAPGIVSNVESLLKYHDDFLFRANDACIRIASVV